LGALTTQLGVRVEAMDRTVAKTGRHSDVRAYPTVNFGYNLDEFDSLRGGYSRRVQRPRPNLLHPFRIQTGDLSFYEGDADLAPQETHSFERGYQHRKGQTAQLATLYWRMADNEFTSVRIDLGSGATLTRTANLGSSRSGGLELVANGRLAP